MDENVITAPLGKNVLNGQELKDEPMQDFCQPDVIRRASLTEKRKGEFEIFRHNLRLLRASVMKSSNQLSKLLELQSLKRIVDLEEGRASQPKLEEVMKIAKYFNVTTDQLLYQKAEVTFKPCV
jgi:DNA-binding XRE family transcriptional regulator